MPGWSHRSREGSTRHPSSQRECQASSETSDRERQPTVAKFVRTLRISVYNYTTVCILMQAEAVEPPTQTQPIRPVPVLGPHRPLNDGRRRSSDARASTRYCADGL